MAAGTGRAYTLADVFSQITGASGAASTVSTTISGVGYVGEANESSTSSDAVTTLVQSAQPWDQAQWGSVTWG